MADNKEDRGDIATRFKMGNSAWKARSSHGRNPVFSDPDQLWGAACEYFKWVEENPLWEVKSYQFQGAPVQDLIPKMRAMTIGGLCVFLDIAQQTFLNYKNNPDFLDVCTKIDQIIRDQKLTGAAADLFNASIIARDLGLADKQENNVIVQTHEEWLKTLK